MKLRPLLGALVLVAGFYYVTSIAHWNAGQFVRRATASWYTPGSASTAGFSTDELNNRRRSLHRGAAQGRYRLPHMTPAI